MGKEERIKSGIALAIVIATLALMPSACAEAIIIDHTCTNLSQIPDEWIDAVQDYIKLHYAHTSHGGQLTTGLERIENADINYSQVRGSKYLPTEAGALCIFDGQEYDMYITPDEYWDSPAGRNYTQDVIDNNSMINVSMWSWCCQLTSYSEAHVQTYLDVIESFETANPDVRFVYMTCNAQETGGNGYNRYLCNEQIRSWVRDHPEENRVLFDFADLDSWRYNLIAGEWEHATYEYSSIAVPVEHLRFHGSQAGHTTYESCEQKGKAVWWMMARFAGWDGVPENGVIYVPDNYTTIQWAVDNATAGDTIIVRDDTYNEDVNVNKQLTIRSENGSANCIVDAANPGGHVFEVTANYVNISGFTITNATEYSEAGVYIDSVGHCNISDNNVSNNKLGIYLDNSSCNRVTNNTANMNEDINIILSLSSLNTLINNTASYSGTGIHLQDSSDNMLLNNTASENAYGICLFLSSCDNNLTGNIANSNTGEYGGISMVSDSNDNTLTSNNVSDNSQYGIYLFLSCNNNISCNNVNSNSNYGIYLDDSNNNLIYNNYFNNTNNAYDNGTNVWNITNTTGPNIIGGSWLGGNYWSDYAGIDNDGDGLGDTMLPYNTSGGIQQGGDWHPLTEVATSLPDLEITDLRVCWSDNCRICYNLTNIGTGTALAGHNTSLFVESLEKARLCRYST